jgi:hypothetical protein
VFLNLRELRALTGRVHRKKIVQWLKENRWRHVVDSDGTPKVDRNYYLKKLVASNDQTYHPASGEPNFAALVKRRIKDGS